MSTIHNPPISKEEVLELIPAFEKIDEFCNSRECDRCVFSTICDAMSEGMDRPDISITCDKALKFLNYIKEHPYEED